MQEVAVNVSHTPASVSTWQIHEMRFQNPTNTFSFSQQHVRLKTRPPSEQLAPLRQPDRLGHLGITPCSKKNPTLLRFHVIQNSTVKLFEINDYNTIYRPTYYNIDAFTRCLKLPASNHRGIKLRL